MKKLLFVVLAAAASMSAASIQCGIEQNVKAATAVYSCPGIGPLAGNTFTNVFISATLAWSDTTPNFVGSYDYLVASANPQTTFSGPTVNVGNIVSNANGGVGLGSYTGPSFGPFVSLAGFNVSVTGSAHLADNIPQNASASVFLNYTVTPDQTGTPEPMTMSLMGAGLLALGIAGRRFRRS